MDDRVQSLARGRVLAEESGYLANLLWNLLQLPEIVNVFERYDVDVEEVAESSRIILAVLADAQRVGTIQQQLNERVMERAQQLVQRFTAIVPNEGKREEPPIWLKQLSAEIQHKLDTL